MGSCKAVRSIKILVFHHQSRFCPKNLKDKTNEEMRLGRACLDGGDQIWRSVVRRLAQLSGTSLHTVGKHKNDMGNASGREGKQLAW